MRYGVSEETERKWKRRDSVQDLSKTPHTLQIETEQKTVQWIVFPSRTDGSSGCGGRSVAEGRQSAPLASRDLNRACPIRISKILTDNGKDYRSVRRFPGARRVGKPRVRPALRRARHRAPVDRNGQIRIRVQGRDQKVGLRAD